MGNLIEVEIENKSYIELLNLEHQRNNTLKLTTLEDNQSAVIIKIFLNKSGLRIPLKEFNIQHLTPKVSGLPRFELAGSYDNKRLFLDLRVDGKKYKISEIKLSPYLRNKFIPLIVIISIIAALLLIWGGKWFITNIGFGRKASSRQTVISKPELLSGTTGAVPKATTPIEKPDETTPKVKTAPPKEPMAEKIKPASPIEKIQITTETPIVGEVKASKYTAYFPPNNSSITKGAEQILKKLALELKKTPNAKVEISGHCALTGTEEGREKLSKERAYNVAAYLKNEGWRPEIEPVILWYGGTKPVTSDPEEIYRNRRVDIRIQ